MEPDSSIVIFTLDRKLIKTNLYRDLTKFEDNFKIIVLDSIDFEHSKEIIANENINNAVCVEWNKDYFMGKKVDFQILYAHPSLLPKYRGYGAITEQFTSGVCKSGASFYIQNELVDGGDILFSKEISIDFEDYPKDFIDKYTKVVKDFINTLMKNGIDSFSKTPQDHSRSFYLSRKRNKNGLIDFNKDAYSIFNFIKGYSYPFFGAYTLYKDQKLIILKSIIENWQGNYGASGEIIKSTEDYLEIACGNGTILIYDIFSIDGISLDLREFKTGEFFG